MTPLDYVEKALEIIVASFRPSDPTGGMTVATTAFLVKRKLGDQRLHGFLKFKDVLAVLSDQGKLRIGTNSKDALSIWLLVDQTVRKPNLRSNTSKFLRKQLWFAFVAIEPKGKRFFNKESGEVRLGCEDSPGDSWVEIEKLEVEDDRGFAKEFVLRNNLDASEFEESIGADRWFVEFPNQLYKKKSSFPSKWKRERSQRVVGLAKSWSERNGIVPDLIFEKQPRKNFELPLKPKRTPQSIGNVRTEEVREAVLSAVALLPTSELVKLSLPAEHLIAILRPELLQ